MPRKKRAAPPLTARAVGRQLIAGLKGNKARRSEMRQLSPEHYINTGEHQFQLS